MKSRIPKLIPVDKIPSFSESKSAQTDTFDSVVLVYFEFKNLKSPDLAFADLLNNAHQADNNLHKQVISLYAPGCFGSRLIISPIGQISREYHDVRFVADAARKGIQKAKSSGSFKPFIMFPDLPDLLKHLGDDSIFFSLVRVASLLAILQELYESLETITYSSNIKSSPMTFIESIGMYQLTEHEAQYIKSVEEGRIVARDIGSPDPEIMTPLKVAEYIKSRFDGLPVKITVLSDRKLLQKSYPLFDAVARASYHVDRHYPCVVKLEYVAPNPTSHLYFVGKGVVYDTGGADVKSCMRGMSRDKCGAAGVAGLMYSVGLEKPENVSITSMLALVRNSVGSDSYVSDEIILSRAGVRVLVGNTDAEGRMAMTDLLAECVELCLEVKRSNPNIKDTKLFTVATLTGHAIKAYGPYPACLDNGVARKLNVSKRLSEVGYLIGEPWEVSRLRENDLKMVLPTSNREDVIQCNTEPSSATPRGHYFPAVFMTIASGLDKYTMDQVEPSKRMSYTHLDIAGSAEEYMNGSGSLPKVTGSPVASLFTSFVDDSVLAVNEK